MFSTDASSLPEVHKGGTEWDQDSVPGSQQCIPRLHHCHPGLRSRIRTQHCIAFVPSYIHGTHDPCIPSCMPMRMHYDKFVRHIFISLPQDAESSSFNSRVHSPHIPGTQSAISRRIPRRRKPRITPRITMALSDWVALTKANLEPWWNRDWDGWHFPAQHFLENRDFPT